MRALWSARVRISPKASDTLLSTSCEKPSLRHASRTSASAPLRSPRTSSARAMGELALGGERRPLREIGGTRPASGRSWNAAASALRRNVTMLGQFGLAEMNAT